PARVPGGRARGSGRDPAHAVLRVDRCDAAVARRAHLRVLLDGGSRGGSRALAERSGRPGLDRSLWRSRRRRLRGVPEAFAPWLGQPGLEGLVERGGAPRWLVGRDPDRACRGAGLRVPGEVATGPAGAGPGG